jgi:hypothetical protein
VADAGGVALEGGVVADAGGVVADAGGVVADAGGVVADAGGVALEAGGVAGVVAAGVVALLALGGFSVSADACVEAQSSQTATRTGALAPHRRRAGLPLRLAGELSPIWPSC